MNRMRTARNIAIVVAIAAAVHFVPGGSRATEAFVAAVYVAFGVAFGYIGLRIYRERRVAIHSLGDRHRGLLYGGLALAIFEWGARARMWETSLGELVWFVLAGLVVYALMEVFRRSRAY